MRYRTIKPWGAVLLAGTWFFFQRAGLPPALEQIAEVIKCGFAPSSPALHSSLVHWAASVALRWPTPDGACARLARAMGAPISLLIAAATFAP